MPPSAHLFASLTADTLPSEVPFCIGSDAQMLSRYCKALNMAFKSRAPAGNGGNAHGAAV